MALDNPLWRYALTLYAAPGVEQCCLQLQDQGAAINRLLLACWLGSRGVAVAAVDWPQLELPWRSDVTEPLRRIRYRVRAQRSAQPALEACYRALRQAELAAEQVELMLLWQRSRAWPRQPANAGTALILEHLNRYRQLTAQPLSERALEQLAEAAGACRSAAELSRAVDT